MKFKILSLAIVALATGCSKEGTVAEKNSPVLKMAKKVYKMESPYNSKNPADSIGIIHNEALSFVYKNLTEHKDFSEDAKKRYLVAFFEKRYGGNLMKSIEQRDEYYRKYDRVPIMQLTEKLPCSRVMASTVNSILLAASEIKSPEGYNAFKKHVLVFEQRVLNGELKMSRTEADQLLHFTSVIRHSMWFWLDAVANNDNQNEAEFLRKVLRAVLGSLADAHGALASLFAFLSFKYVLEDAALDSALMLWAFDS